MNWNRKLFLLLWSLMVISAPSVLGQTPTSEPLAIKAPALYEQCTQPLPSKPEAAAEIKRAVTALKDKEAKTRIEAAQQLSKSCDQRAIEPLVGALKDGDPLVRVAAIEALGQLGDRSTIPALIEILPDKDWRVGKALGLSLCSFQAHSAGDEALNNLASPINRPIADEHDLRMRCVTILAINQLREVNFSRKAVNFVFVLLDDERESYRRIAEQTMFELKKTRNGVHELIGIIKQNNDPIFRQKAADWLGKLRAEEGRRVLGETSVGDRDARVRGAAKESLRLLDEDKKDEDKKNEPGSVKDRSTLFQ